MNLIPILYENDEIYIINKPGGVSVQGGNGVSHPLDEEFAKQVGHKIHLVHRLDKDTAGLMIVAKNPGAASKWTKLIASKNSGLIQKTYIAFCFGTLSKKKGVINESVLQHGEVKSAVTNYEIVGEGELEISNPNEMASGNAVESLKRQSGGGQKIHVSKIKLDLQTGRMHQIRIHLAKNGCPIIGDDTHGNFRLNKIARKEFKIKTLQLYAARLAIPIDGKNMVFEIDVPELI